MFRLPNIPTSTELIDKSFRRGAKKANEVRSTKEPRSIKLRKAEEVRVDVIGNVIESDLRKVITDFPSYDQLPEFYKRLLDIRIEKDVYKKSLGALQWCIKNARQLKKETIREIRANNDPKRSKAYLGRVSSIVERISGDLEKLIEIKMTLKSFPVVKDDPTLVIAGYPNVGKSTFMSTLTGSRVKIASYPFTTKDLLIGHRKIRHQEYQIIDSPGLLDRPTEERNRIEMQAMLAMQALAHAILVIIDPTMDLEPQLNLLREIAATFDYQPYVAVNKKDIMEKEKIDKAVDTLSKLGDYKVYVISALDEKDCIGVFDGIFREQG